MECPVCREPMVALEHEEIEVDYCPGCGGVWLDEGEIELLFGDQEACAQFLTLGSPVEDGGEKKRKCPACDTVMTKEATEGEPPVLFDACPKRHGLWFDAGELQQVLRAGVGPGRGAYVAAFLHGLFGECE